MAHITRNVAILLILCLFQSVLTSASNPILTEHHFPGHLVFTDSTSLNGTNMLHVVCSTEAMLAQEKHCRVMLATHSEERNRYCNVTLHNESAVIPQATLLPGNRALVLWHERLHESRTTVKLLFVDLNGCRTHRTNLTIDVDLYHRARVEQLFPVAVYDGAVEVAFKNEKLCGKEQCKVTFDAEGKEGSRVAWYAIREDEIVLAPIEAHSPAKGVLMIKYKFEANRTAVYLVGAEGPKELKKYSDRALLSDDQDWLIIYSTAHETIGICTNIKSTATCTQFDQEGKQKLEASVKIESGARLYNMHNLQNGGYLLLSGSCSYDCKGRKPKYHVTKVNANGERVGSLELVDFQCNVSGPGPWSQFFENERKEKCVSLACPKQQGDSVLFFSKCFSDKEFTS